MVALVILTLLLVPVVVVASTLTNPDKVKTILDEGEVYTTTVDNALKIIEFSPDSAGMKEGPKSQEETLDQTLKKSGILQPEGVAEVFKATLDDEYLKTKVEPNLDLTYGYLRGDTQDLKFSVDFRDRSEKFQTELKAYLLKQLQKLPTCPANQSVNVKDLQLLEATCLPKGTNLEKEVDKTVADLVKETPFEKALDQKELEISNIELKNAKSAFGYMEKLPLLFWALYILIAAAIVMTGKTIFRGLSEVGIISFIAGMLLMIEFALIGSGNTITSHVTDSANSSPQSQAVLNIVQPLAESASTNIKMLGITYGGIIAALGIASFGLSILLKKHHDKHGHFQTAGPTPAEPPKQNEPPKTVS